MLTFYVLDERLDMHLDKVLDKILEINCRLEKEIRLRLFDNEFSFDLDVFQEFNGELRLLIENGQKLKDDKNNNYELNDKYKKYEIDLDKIQLAYTIKEENYDDFEYYIRKEFGIIIKKEIELNCDSKKRKIFDYQAIFNRAIENYTKSITNGNLALLNGLALDNYETRPNNGKIIFIGQDIKKSDIESFNEFKEAIPFKETERRLIRKVLELTDPHYAIIVKGTKIIGLGLTANGKSVTYKHFGWELNLNKNIKVHYEKGEYKIKRIDEKKIYEEELSKIILDAKNREALVDLIWELNLKKHHGALLVFSDCAETEAERLGSRKRGISFSKAIDFSKKSNLKIFSNLSAIDGALLLDFNLQCFGIGYILDGHAYIAGSTARGSRYNSAKCYLWNLKSRYIANSKMKHRGLVFSEDGGMNCLDTEVDEKSIQIDGGRVFKFNSIEGEEVILNLDGK